MAEIQTLTVRLTRKLTASCLLALFCCISLHALAADYPPQAVILQYHHVSSASPASTSISAEDFRVHMQYLRQSGFSVLRLEEVITALRTGASLPDKTAVITFDDAYLSVYEQAFPLLREMQFPFTVFISSGLVNSNSSLYASWEQLREMAAAGATMANHTVSHPYLLDLAAGQSQEQWLAAVKEEIIAAEQKIRQETGQSHRFVAYPYGEYSPEIQKLVADLGYTGFGQQSGPVSAYSDFTALPRFPFSGSYASMNTFPVKVLSLAFRFSSNQKTVITDSATPSIELDFNGAYQLQSLSCYSNNVPMRITAVSAAEQRYLVEPRNENSGRRFRYNCTLPDSFAMNGRYYWLSVQWINPDIPE